MPQKRDSLVPAGIPSKDPSRDSMEFPQTAPVKDSSHAIVGIGGRWGLSSAWVSTALSYSKNPRAGLGMPARPKLLRCHLRPVVNHTMKTGPGGCL